MVVFSAGTLVALDPAAPAWEILDTYDQPPLDGYGYTFGAHLVYDSANHRLIVLEGERLSGEIWVPATEVWAFDTRTSQWSELLPAVEVAMRRAAAAGGRQSRSTGWPPCWSVCDAVQ